MNLTYIKYSESIGDYEIYNARLKATVKDIGGKLIADIDGLNEVGVRLVNNGDFKEGDRVRLIFDNDGLIDIEMLD